MTVVNNELIALSWSVSWCIPGTLTMRQEYTLDGILVHCSAPQTHRFTQFRLASPPTRMSLKGWRQPEDLEEIHMKGGNPHEPM